MLHFAAACAQQPNASSSEPGASRDEAVCLTESLFLGRNKAVPFLAAFRLHNLIIS